MKKKGFTLVELLAVIAILAILVIMTLPAVLRMFNNARRDSFTNEVNTIIRTTRQQYLLSGGQAQSFSNAEGSTNQLELTGSSDLVYYVEINGMGEITKLQVTNGSFQYDETGVIDVASSSDVEEVTDSNQLVIAFTYLYSSKNTPGQNIGDTLTINNVDVFDNSNSISEYIFTKHLVDGSNKILKSYIAFKVSNQLYYIEGGDGGASYVSNQAYIASIFGNDNCGFTFAGTDNEFYGCHMGYDLYAKTYPNGKASVFNDTWDCELQASGNSYCFSLLMGD